MKKLKAYSIAELLALGRDHGYNATALAAVLNVSLRQLHRHVHQMCRRSPQDWLNHERLLAASALLEQIRSVKVVAAELGYHHVSHFSAAFKSHYGICPTEFLARYDHEMLLHS